MAPVTWLPASRRARRNLLGAQQRVRRSTCRPRPAQWKASRKLVHAPRRSLARRSYRGSLAISPAGDGHAAFLLKRLLVMTRGIQKNMRKLSLTRRRQVA
jgi:hypothetical protein